MSRIKCDVFELKNDIWSLICEDGIVIESSNFTIGNTKRTIALTEIFNLGRFPDPDDGSPCFQFLTSSSEFGLKFPGDSEAETFFLAVSKFAASQTVVKVVCSRDIRLMELIGGRGWCEVEADKDLTVTVAERPKDFECFLFIKKASEILFSSSLTAALCLRFFPTKLEVTFIGQDGRTGEGHYFALNFSDKKEFSDFHTVCLSAIASKAKQAAVIIPEISDSEDGGDEPEAVTPRSGPEYETEAMEIDRLGLGKDKRRLMAVGARKGRVFIASAEGSSWMSSSGRSKPKGISAFEVGEGKIGELGVLGSKHKSSVADLGSLRNLYLWEDERALLVNSREFGVGSMDLTKETVVSIVDSKKAAEKGVSIDQLVEPCTSSGTSEVVFGLNENTLFSIDKRVPEGIVGKHLYNSKVRMNCGAQTSEGVAVGSRTGQVRLYDGKLNADGDLKRAKSLFPGLGDAVSGVEVSEDGNWLLVTSEKYIQLIRVTGGFSKSITGEKQPPVFSMKLTIPGPILVQQGIKRVHFSKAHFAGKEGIISSTGSFRVSWDLEAAKKGVEVVKVWRIPGNSEVIDLHAVAAGEIVALYEDGLGVGRQ